VADNKVIRAALNLYKATKFTSNLSGWVWSLDKLVISSSTTH
jgi:hypothetical protein